METLYINIGTLVNVRQRNELLRNNELAILPVIENAFLLVEDGIISAFGNMYELELQFPQKPQRIVDVEGKTVMPCWCDSHTHLVFAGSRENEFVDKIRGRSYAEIAANGGGILNSAKKLADNTEERIV